MIEIGFHTDAFNSSYWNFEKCLQWAQENDVPYIECGTIDGVSWLHGLGYQPHVSLTEDPYALREKMEGYGVKFSQLDAAFPVSLPEGASLGLIYILNSIRWAKLVGCSHIDTTDHMFKPDGQTDEEALEMMKRVYGEVLETAAQYDMIINIEPHGYYTTKPEFMEQMLNFYDTPLLRMNMDTGNTFIAKECRTRCPLMDFMQLPCLARRQRVSRRPRPISAYRSCHRTDGRMPVSRSACRSASSRD